MMLLNTGVLLLLVGGAFAGYCEDNKYLSCLSPSVKSALWQDSVYGLMYETITDEIAIVLLSNDASTISNTCSEVTTSVTPCLKMALSECPDNFVNNGYTHGLIDAMTMLCQTHKQEFLDNVGTCATNVEDIVNKFSHCRQTQLQGLLSVPVENRILGACQVRQQFNTCLSDAMQNDCSQKMQDLVLEFSAVIRKPDDISMGRLCTSDGNWKPVPDPILKDCGYVKCFTPMVHYGLSWNMNDLDGLQHDTIIFQVVHHDNDTLQQICDTFQGNIVPCWQSVQNNCQYSDDLALTRINAGWKYICSERLPDLLNVKTCLNENRAPLFTNFGACLKPYNAIVGNLSSSGKYAQRQICIQREVYNQCISNALLTACGEQAEDLIRGFSIRIMAPLGMQCPTDRYVTGTAPRTWKGHIISFILLVIYWLT